MRRAHEVVVGIVLALSATASCGTTGAGTTRTGTTDPGRVTHPMAQPGPGSACLTMPLAAAATEPARALVDWVDFVQLDGVQFVAVPERGILDVPQDRLGPVVGRVECRLSELSFSRSPGDAVDGDAAYLPVGTQVRAIRGHSPSCRVAARVDGGNRVYLADHTRDVTVRTVPPCGAGP